MSELFLKFKRKIQIARALKSVLAGLAGGGFVGGISLLLSKLALLPFAPIIALAIGGGVGVITAVLFFFLLRTSDKKLAETLDQRFTLQEKVQTMLAYEHEQGAMLDLQRQSAETALSGIPTKKFKIRRLWIYLTAFCIGAAATVGGFLVPDKRNQPQPPKPFAITELQIAGIEELIRYVDGSQMEELYRTPVSTSLSELLSDLKAATTEPEMQAALTQSMATISSVTYNSSSLTEILNALWATGDTYVKGLAVMLDTSSWKEPNWGDFAEKLSDYKQTFRHETVEGTPPTEEELATTLQLSLDLSATKINVALPQSKIAQDDALYVTVAQFATAQKTITEQQLTYEQMLAEIDRALDEASQCTYATISQLKINANVGEYTMTKLATLFPVPLPRFERPDLSSGNGNQGTDENRPNDKGPNDGGIGEGATFGSKDLILDPLTGNYVEYGSLINKYYAVMNEKLNSGNYTDEQKQLIKNYFSLLYGGIEKEDGK